MGSLQRQSIQHHHLYEGVPGEDELVGTRIQHIHRIDSDTHMLIVGEEASDWSDTSKAVKVGRVTASIHRARSTVTVEEIVKPERIKRATDCQCGHDITAHHFADDDSCFYSYNCGCKVYQRVTA
tara:strand:+ start:11640 stop:12014 length:375 start_codon:yes stop_codon:yes gene_type:complete